MSTMYDGRNVIKINNSSGKCLLENWCEERAVSHIDPTIKNSDEVITAKVFKDGHSGLLTTNFNGTSEKLTTHKDSYKPHMAKRERERGVRSENFERLLYEQIRQEVENEFQPPKHPMPTESVTHEDYNKPNFVPQKPAFTAPHDYRLEQPVSFWTEHREKAHGVSQSKNFDTPFRKNAAFSKPIQEQWDQPAPYEHDHVPNM